MEISKNDENFLKNFLKDFYRKIIETNDFNNFEKISIEWIHYELEDNDKNPKEILEIMRNHKSKILFTSFIGFFYQHGIGCDVDIKISLEFYQSANNNDEIEKDFNILHLIRETNKDEFNLLKNKNIIIGKYLLSLFYYKDIILGKGVNYN